MPVYKGDFSNKMGSYQVAVFIDFKFFEMRFGDFMFRGMDMDSFELINVVDFYN